MLSFNVIVALTCFILYHCHAKSEFAVADVENSDVKELIVDILNRLADKENRIKSLEVQNQQQQSEIEIMKAEMVDQQKHILDLEEQVEIMTRQDTEQSKTFSNGIKKPDSVPETYLQTFPDGETTNEAGFEDVQIIHSIRQASQIVSEDPVAFFATLNESLTHASEHQNIPFENVITNVGDAYNPHVGGFIAPIAGIYVFSVSLLSYPPNDDTAYEFTRNNVVVSRLYHTARTSGWDTASQTIVLQLKKDDVVAVQNRDSDKQLAGADYTTFAGFLLQPHSGDTGIVIG